MTTCILHGGYTRENNALNLAFYRAFAERIPDKGTVLFVYFATKKGESEKDTERFIEHCRFITAAAPDKTFSFVIADRDSFAAQAALADAIFLNGGAPENLMEVLRTVPDLKSLFEGKVLAGSSSGAFALSAYYYSIDTVPGVYEGFGIAPVRTVCHFESDTDEHIGQEGIEALEKYPKDLELVVLKDYEHKVLAI